MKRGGSDRPPLVVIPTPTLMEGMPQLLHAAWVEYWVERGDSMRHVVEALHQVHTRDVVVTPDGAWWL